MLETATASFRTQEQRLARLRELASSQRAFLSPCAKPSRCLLHGHEGWLTDAALAASSSHTLSRSVSETTQGGAGRKTAELLAFCLCGSGWLGKPDCHFRALENTERAKDSGVSKPPKLPPRIGQRFAHRIRGRSTRSYDHLTCSELTARDSSRVGAGSACDRGPSSVHEVRSCNGSLRPRDVPSSKHLRSHRGPASASSSSTGRMTCTTRVESISIERERASKR